MSNSEVTLKPRYSGLPPTVCRDCGGPTGEWWSKYEYKWSNYRCRTCYTAQVRERAFYKKRRGTSVYPCDICAKPFVRGIGGGLYCSDPCRTAGLARAMKDINRRKSIKRRGASVGVPYTLAEVAARDGFRCHLCGSKVNMRLSGMRPRGPTIDHLVPVSAGGLDSVENVRLAHRVCNTNRGVRGEVQLLLLG